MPWRIVRPESFVLATGPGTCPESLAVVEARVFADAQVSRVHGPAVDLSFHVAVTESRCDRTSFSPDHSEPVSARPFWRGGFDPCRRPGPAQHSFPWGAGGIAVVRDRAAAVRMLRRIERAAQGVLRQAAAPSETTSFRVRKAGGVLPLHPVGRKLAAVIFSAIFR